MHDQWNRLSHSHRALWQIHPGENIFACGLGLRALNSNYPEWHEQKAQQQNRYCKCGQISEFTDCHSPLPRCDLHDEMAYRCKSGEHERQLGCQKGNTRDRRKHCIIGAARPGTVPFLRQECRGLRTVSIRISSHRGTPWRLGRLVSHLEVKSLTPTFPASISPGSFPMLVASARRNFREFVRSERLFPVPQPIPLSIKYAALLHQP
jgi:hypothetical protein